MGEQMEYGWNDNPFAVTPDLSYVDSIYTYNYQVYRVKSLNLNCLSLGVT